MLFLFAIEIFYSSYAGLSTGYSTKDYELNITNSEKALSCIDDSSFYRIKNNVKIAKNTAALCNYNGISTYSSLTNSKLNDLLYKLGFSISLNAFDDKSFEPVFSSVIGTKYIFDIDKYDDNPCLEYISSIKVPGYSDTITQLPTDNIYIYKNKYCLSPAFTISDKVKNFKFDGYANPFELINAFAVTVCDCEDIYSKVEIENNKISVNEGEQLYLYSKSKFFNLNFNAMSFKNSNSKNELIETLYDNNLTATTLIRGSYTDDYIYFVHSSVKGGYIDVPKIAENNSIDNDKIYNTNDYIAYKLNLENYTKLMNILSNNQLQVTSFDSNNINGSINTPSATTIMTSIPYSKGWQVKVNGKAIKTSSIADTFLCFDLDKGEHTVQLSYYSPGLNIGIIMSIVALFILILLTIIKEKSRGDYE